MSTLLTRLAAVKSWGRGRPEPFLDSSGRHLTASISEKVHLEINGVEQGMVIRGRDVGNPVLLWVHGGPGMPDYFLTRRYPVDVMDLFTIVWWDQRGAGLSYSREIPPWSMNVDQFIDDTLAVTDYLRRRFGREKVYLLGHSWGSFIALQAAARSPERYYAYIGMAQMVHQLESEKLAYDYLVEAYRRRGDAGMVHALEKAPVSMTDGTPDGYLAVRDKAMHRLGVGTTRDMRSVITGVFLASWVFPGYTIREKVGLWRGRSFSRSFGLWDKVIRVDLRQVVVEVALPVYFVEGRYDYTCITGLARDYFEKLRAPSKGFYEFPESAHSPILEQPTLARSVLKDIVLAVGPSQG